MSVLGLASVADPSFRTGIIEGHHGDASSTAMLSSSTKAGSSADPHCLAETMKVSPALES